MDLKAGIDAGVAIAIRLDRRAAAGGPVQRLVDEAYERYRANDEGATLATSIRRSRGCAGDLFGICVAGTAATSTRAGDADASSRS